MRWKENFTKQRRKSFIFLHLQRFFFIEAHTILRRGEKTVRGTKMTLLEGE